MLVHFIYGSWWPTFQMQHTDFNRWIVHTYKTWWLYLSISDKLEQNIGRTDRRADRVKVTAGIEILLYLLYKVVFVDPAYERGLE